MYSKTRLTARSGDALHLYEQKINERVHSGLGYILTRHCYGKSGVKSDFNSQGLSFLSYRVDYKATRPLEVM